MVLYRCRGSSCSFIGLNELRDGRPRYLCNCTVVPNSLTVLEDRAGSQQALIMSLTILNALKNGL